MQILTQYFEHSVLRVINISPELNTDFKCIHPKLEICHKISKLLQLRNADVYSCILIPADIFWRFMSHIVEMKIIRTYLFKIPPESQKR